MRPVLFAMLGLAAAVAAGPAAAAVAFARADANHDGVVTFEEAKRVMPRLARVHYDKCDPNRDGAIDQREYPLLDNFYWMIYKQE